MRATIGFAALLATLTAGPAAARDTDPAPAVKLVKKKDGVAFYVGENLVTRYNTSEKLSKPNFWPVNALPKLAVTRSWPMEKDADEPKDHIHQRSMWFCHGDVIPEGVEIVRSGDKKVTGVDFWSEGKNHGNIVCVQIGEPKGGKVVTKNEWREPGGKKIMDETRTITLVPIGKNKNLLILDIDLHASVCPITFGDTKEGSLGVRVRKTVELKGGSGRLVSAEGDSGEAAVWGRISAWNDYSGPLGKDGPVGGIAIFADPRNKVDTAWHSRGYGLMAANPFGRKVAGFPGRKGQTELVKIAKGDHLRLRYGVYLHAGDAKEGKVAEAYARFAKMDR